MRLTIPSAVVWLAVLGSIPAVAQTASITGRVTDASGAVLPNSGVTLTNVDTRIDRSTNTNESGYYTFSLLQPGRYQMRVESKGFKTLTRSGLVFEVDQRAELNLTLDIGAITEQIEVTANVQQLNTVEASRGQVIENRRIVEMPLNGRNYNQLAIGRYGPAACGRPHGGIQCQWHARLPEQLPA